MNLPKVIQIIRTERGNLTCKNCSNNKQILYYLIKVDIEEPAKIYCGVCYEILKRNYKLF